jgi:hypothetical protein
MKTISNIDIISSYVHDIRPPISIAALLGGT